MNYRSIAARLGKILLVSAAFYAAPIVVALIYREFSCIAPFLIAAGCSLLIGGLLALLQRKEEKLRTKEGLVVVGLSWICISALGALPLLFGKVFSSYIDCFFEMTSGFTTTGATVLTDFGIAKCMHFWRCFSHWLGGMGILVFMLALLPSHNAGDFQLMKFESPGPQVGKLVSKVRFTATILYLIYFGLTILEFVFLLAGGMDTFNAVILAFSTAGTGGFAASAESIRAFQSVYVDVVITVFMFVFSVNFNLYYLLLLKKFSHALKDEELRFFVSYLILAILAVSVNNTLANPTYQGDFFSALRYSAFAVISLSSTTGFMTADFAVWPIFSQLILLATMFMGGMAGSTGGGAKASRVLILFKSGRADTMRVLRPRSACIARMNKKPLSAELISAVRNYFFLSVAIIAASTLVVSFDANADLVTAFTASLTCFSNVGPGLGNVIGPVGSFACLSGFTKLVLSLNMLFGRLEIFPILLLFSYKTWSKSY